MLFKYFIIFVVLTNACKVVQCTGFDDEKKLSEYVLPKDTIKVLHYNISLELKKDCFNTNSYFEGFTTITIQFLKNTNKIKLHAHHMNFTKIEIRTVDGLFVELEKEIFINNETEILTVTTRQQLKTGTKYRLEFEYAGEFATDNNGFYRSSYTDSEKKVRYLLSTQFESTYARRAFPCFDEPEYKATFQIQIKHPSEYSAFSNSIGISTVDPNDLGYNITRFETTPVMTTYTVAFTISDFTCSSGETIDGSVLNLVCSRKETEPFRKLALELAPKAVKAMEDFTKVQFSVSKFKKLHQIAIPDFAAGAMENWGMHTFREQSMLYDPEETSVNNKHYIVITIVHEVCHFWFGNLVTMKWWSDLFLSEGFAAYFEYFINHKINPKAQFDKLFVVESLQSALASDVLSNSEPLSFQVYTPVEISYRFVSFLYNKGSSMLRMMEKFMGLDNFQAGLVRYLTQHEFNNTTPDDLWNNLQQFTKDLPNNLTFKSVMDNWTLKTGYPVLNVSTVGKNIIITQKRFVSKDQSITDDKWHVPISLTTSADINKFENTKPEFWLSSEEGIIVDRLKCESDWVILNNQQAGYYRVDYSQDLWEKIAAALYAPNFDDIHELNRAQIIDDFFHFATFGYRSFSELLDLYQFLKNDESYFSWYSAASAFSKMMSKISNDNLKKQLSNYILNLLQNVYQSVTIDKREDDDVYSLKKFLIMRQACKLNFQDCLDKVLADFETFKTEKIKPDKDLRTIIYCNGLRHSKDPRGDWNFLWQQFQNVKTSGEQLDIMVALGCTNDRTLLKNYLEKSIDPKSGIRQQDAIYAFQSVAQNSVATDIVLDFLTFNYQSILKYYSVMNTIPHIFSSLEKALITVEYVDKFAKFIENTKLGEYEKVARGSLEIARNNLKEIESFERELSSYFDGGPSGSGSFIEQPKINIMTFFLIVTLILF